MSQLLLLYRVHDFPRCGRRNSHAFPHLWGDKYLPGPAPGTLSILVPTSLIEVSITVISRRGVLKAGAYATGLCLAPVRSAVPSPLALPAVDDLRGELLVERSGLRGLATVEHLGASDQGRGIDLISVGKGPRSALIVGAPHPNEPIGCLTIVRMLRRLGSDRRLRDASGYRWHFIPAIDMDGLALNEGWFHRPLTLANYCRDFYRPAFNRQPEYSFPIKLPGYEFSASTLENLRWQRALELTRPDLQCSLHGADAGGSFYIISENRAGLGTALAREPERHGVSLNAIGEPFAEMEPFQPGVSSFPDIRQTVTHSIATGKDPEVVWGAGDSSAGFSTSRYGTFNMVCEVPLWEDARQRDPRPSSLTMRDVLDEQIAQLREDEQILSRAMPALRGRAASFEAVALTAALEEAHVRSQSQPAALEEIKSSNTNNVKLSTAELVEYQSGSEGMRAPAMLARLARICHDSVIEASAGKVLGRRMSAQLRRAALTPIPLQATTALQMDSILACARLLT